MAHKKFFCIDAHTCGNPVRLVAGGGPLLEGNSMMEKRLHFLREYDWIRKGLMFEPRGHDMMSGSILYPPHDPQNDIGVLFIETSGCLPMCGHGTIGTITNPSSMAMVMVPMVPCPHIGRQPLVSMYKTPISFCGSVGGYKMLPLIIS